MTDNQAETDLGAIADQLTFLWQIKIACDHFAANTDVPTGGASTGLVRLSALSQSCDFVVDCVTGQQAHAARPSQDLSNQSGNSAGQPVGAWVALLETLRCDPTIELTEPALHLMHRWGSFEDSKLLVQSQLEYLTRDSSSKMGRYRAVLVKISSKSEACVDHSTRL